MTTPEYGAEMGWQPSSPRLRPGRILVSWLIAAASVYAAAAVVPPAKRSRPWSRYWATAAGPPVFARLAPYWASSKRAKAAAPSSTVSSASTGTVVDKRSRAWRRPQ